MVIDVLCGERCGVVPDVFLLGARLDAPVHI